MRLKVDYDADGTFDAELSPLVAAEGEDLEGQQPNVELVVRENEQGQAVVVFTPAANSPTPAVIYYCIYPSHPELQIYTEPIVVEERSFVLYGAVGSTGTRQPTRELEIMGGIEDAQLEASIDGEPLEVRTSVPGQNAIVTVQGEPGQQVQIEIGAMTGGVQQDNQATLEIIGPDGMRVREQGILGAEGLGAGPWSDRLHLTSGGVYTIVIDPRLANLISTTVTLSPVP